MYPRPQLKRPNWHSLDGEWQFSFSPADWPTQVNFNQTILVPYAPETPRSGVVDLAPHRVAWYRRRVTLPPELRPSPGERLLLHIGAADHHARVWVGGQYCGEHVGGYTPFSFDVTPHVEAADNLSGELEVIIQVTDDPANMAQPRGKQDWHAGGQGHGIWYPRTTGIWQTVWLEKVPQVCLETLNWTPDVARFSLQLNAQLTPQAIGKKLRVRLSMRGQSLSDDTFLIQGSLVERTISLPDPGIDDARDDFLWSPEHPQLIDATLEVLDGETVLDSVQSYAALRSVSLHDGRFCLNGRPYPLKLALDQGYWPEGGLSATPDELRADVELAKKLGFNGVRKHQKIENPMWLEWCDRLGLLVWEELPSAYAFTAGSVADLTRTWLEATQRDRSHPCIVAWVPFNESWGVPDLPVREDQRHAVRALYHLTRTLDPTRPSVGNDGWEQVTGDLLTIHDYHHDPAVLLERYRSVGSVQDTLNTFRPGGRAIALKDFTFTDQPVILSEFGGIAYRADGTEGWGYSVAPDSQIFLQRYQELMQAIHACAALSGFCYTQLTDTYQEINGLLTMHREPKADLTALAAATRGHAAPNDHPLGYSTRWLSKEAQP